MKIVLIKNEEFDVPLLIVSLLKFLIVHNVNKKSFKYKYAWIIIQKKLYLIITEDD